jgi:hypothetical protein
LRSLKSFNCICLIGLKSLQLSNIVSDRFLVTSFDAGLAVVTNLIYGKSLLAVGGGQFNKDKVENTLIKLCFKRCLNLNI